MFEEREILTKAGEPYTVFTPYSKAWLASFRLPKLRKLKKRAPFTTEVRSEKIPNGPEFFGQQLNHPNLDAGEEVAAARLDGFVRGGLAEYATSRDNCSVDGTSKLSAHLRAGTVSIRDIMGKVHTGREQLTEKARASCDVFVKELIWREFYLQILHNFPYVMRGNFRRDYDRLEWSNDAEHLRRWQEGTTGYPVVDAAMRCLNATGWMHNRLRMITAMFLTKDLLINWQEGERYFMQRLVDGDMAANNGGWQWTAGTGTDAAPYFRIFNPVTQSRKVDPNGEFIRTWVPELSGLDDNSVHEPWAAKNSPGEYPGRVVLHEEQRPKALAMYEKLKTRRSPRAD